MRYKRILRTAAAIAMLGTVMTAGAMTVSAMTDMTAFVGTGMGNRTTPQSQESGARGGTSESKEEAPEEEKKAVLDGVIQPQYLEGAAEADQLIVVVGTGECNADTYYYKKDSDSWELMWKETSIVGRNGITGQKAEGDGSTPAGTYGFTMAFGLKEDPGSLLPYHKIAKGDYWVDDSASTYYNKLVNTGQTPKSWNSAENMAAASPYYNYALALDYNGDCVPGKGSAIFLHCFTASADRGSAGCIRLPEARVRELVRSVTSRTRIVIAQDLSRLK